MKKFLFIASVAMLAACNSNEPDKTDSMASGSDSTMPMVSAAPISSPYAIAYSSDFAMGDNKNAESLLTLWKDWDNGNLSEHKDIFADSVAMYFADGSMMHSSRDSVIAAAQGARDRVASAVSTVNAIMPVKSVDKDENWALIWGKEVDTDKKGKVDSFYLQETWRFNKEGKADMVYQFKASAASPKK